MLKIQILYQKIQKNKTNSIQYVKNTNIIRLGRSMTKSLQISCIISGISNHSKMDTKHITGNIIHMIHSTKFGTINYYIITHHFFPCVPACLRLCRIHGASSSFNLMLGSVFTLKGGISANIL